MYNIKQGKRKAAFVDHILSRVHTVHQHQSKLKELSHSIASKSLPDPAPIQFLQRLVQLS
jgi:hypothetical protein